MFKSLSVPNLPTHMASANHAPFHAPATASFAASYPKDEFKPVPNNIHMVWVGSEPGKVQEQYLRQWAKMNPSHTVMLWVDSLQFKAYATNKLAQQRAQDIYPDYQSERPMRGLFSQLKVAMQAPVNTEHLPSSKVAKLQVISELNKALSTSDNKQLKALLLPDGGKVNPDNATAVLNAFARYAARTDDKFYQAEAVILDQTTKSWDRYANKPSRDTTTLDALHERFGDLKNVQIRDLSDPSDIRLKNRDVYQHEIMGRNGGYAAASDVARYEIVEQYGGTYTDIDLESTRSLDGALNAHPDLMLIGMAEGKNEASGSKTPYFANALFSAHPGSEMISRLVKNIGNEYRCMKGNEYTGDRYFSRPNKSTIETTGPNALRAHVDRVIQEAKGRPDLTRNDAASLAQRIWDVDQPQNEEFWEVMDSHFRFPDNFVNFETQEQQNSSTKAMAGGPALALKSTQG
ncbi:glycosyltransferase [Pseudomonas sp. 15FMM2]|uniref:Glycosyltransferase n=1 Tax=Pseudomonas imrae TaxID=2992837 RepID=A0ACC7PI15_9PSED